MAKKKKLEPIRLLTDHPLCSGGEEIKDGLGFEHYANVLARAIIGTPGPFTVGVFGDWGTGKTSLMKKIEEQLAGEEKVLPIWFNAWRYEKEEHPIIPLVGSILKGITNDTEEKVLKGKPEKKKSLINALRAIAYGFCAKAKLKIPGLAEVEAAFVAKDMIEQEKGLTHDPLLDKSLYYNAYESLNSIEIDDDTKIVVFIDDLDRCMPNNAVHLLESIKLILDQPQFTFVIGVARSVLEGYLQHRYKKEFGIEELNGRQYLDKIVQLPFNIPSRKLEDSNYKKSLEPRIPEDLADDLEELLPIIANLNSENPRTMLRFINRVQIDSEILKTRTKADYDIALLAVTIIIQQKWPHLFKIITRSENMATELLEFLESEERKSSSLICIEASRLLESDPDFKDLTELELLRTWLSDHDHRNTLTNYVWAETNYKQIHMFRKLHNIYFPADSQKGENAYIDLKQEMLNCGIPSSFIYRNVYKIEDSKLSYIQSTNSEYSTEEYNYIVSKQDRYKLMTCNYIIIPSINFIFTKNFSLLLNEIPLSLNNKITALSLNDSVAQRDQVLAIDGRNINVDNYYNYMRNLDGLTLLY